MRIKNEVGARWFAVTRSVLIAAICCEFSARAVIFYSTADPNYNSSRPIGELADSGWDHEGSWAAFLGTAISPQHFITAKHLGGAVGIKFSFNGVEYTTTAFFDDAESDIRIWQVSGRFPFYAELYPRTDEVGRDLAVFGRGTQRGSEVTVPSLFGSELKGWQWGIADGRKRWGLNRVGSIVSSGEGTSEGAGSGNLLKVPFNNGAGPNEAHLSAGDSGGGLFIKDGATWKLAGINYVVDGMYNTTDTGPGFQAAIFDEGGLYKGSEGNWSRVPNSPFDVAGAFYATRISIRLNWITTIISQTATSDGPILQSAPTVNGPFTDEVGAAVDPSSGVVTLPAPAGVRFYRLNSPSALRIIGTKLQNGNLVFQYQ